MPGPDQAPDAVPASGAFYYTDTLTQIESATPGIMGYRPTDRS